MSDAGSLDWPLPEERIAQTPTEPRDAARLLVDRGDGVTPEHLHVRDLPTLVGPGDLVVVNRSRVLAARLAVRRPTGGRAEALLLEPDTTDDPSGWRALVRPSAKTPPGTTLVGDHDLTVVVGADLGAGERRVTVAIGEDRVTAESAETALAGVGEVPLPPYIRAALDDPERYQTVWASAPGSVAAPTAGLHLTPAVPRRRARSRSGDRRGRAARGHRHVPACPVADLDDHVMHSERFVVPEATRAACAEADRVLAVGTTTTRALEADALGHAGRTDVFIRAGHDWQIVDRMLTNFHLPGSTLLAMIEALVGPRWRDLYAAAVADPGYRFLSFGDAMLLTR